MWGLLKPKNNILGSDIAGRVDAVGRNVKRLKPGDEVSGLDSMYKLDMMRSIGADHVIDYTRGDFTRKGQSYDLILDLAASHSIFDCKRALNPGGIYVMAGGSMGHIFQTLPPGSII